MAWSFDWDDPAETLAVRTLGSFSVSVGGAVISNSTARSHKLWRVFKYLITYRHRMVPIETLIEILWPDSEPENPQDSLYSLVSRLRKLLAENGAQVPYIIFQHDAYQWNPESPITLNIAEFDQLYIRAGRMKTDSEKLLYLKKAVDIYTGDYLAESAYELWILPVTTYYQRLYLRCVEELADIYARASAQDEIIKLCSRAIQNEPYEEKLYERLIKALIISGRTGEAERQYRRYSDLVRKEFGSQPSEALHSLCRSIRTAKGEQLDISDIKQQLDSKAGQRGVFFCTSDVFDQIYELDKRSDERMKFPVFLGLMTLVAETGKPLNNKQLKSAMITLRDCLSKTLRHGDVVSQYSKNQYVLLLSAYLPENAATALTRVQRLFESEYRDNLCATQINLSEIGKAQQIPAK